MGHSGKSRIFISFFSAFLFWHCQSRQEDEIRDLYIPEIVTFAGDTIPIEDPEIRERLEKELWINAYWESNTAMWIKKSGRWFPLIDSILKQNQIPEDFRYLVPIESGFENVTSNKGAVGFWQLMEPTAREFGLIINPEIDQRLDPKLATEAACKLLQRGQKVLGNWTEVAASYNIGISGLQKVMASQYTDQFYDLLINPETGRYFFRAIAAKLILSHPEKYGYSRLNPYPSIESKNQVLDSSIQDLAYWCRQNGFSYKCFRLVNPWIKTGRITLGDSIKSLTISIPINCKVYTKAPLKEIPLPLQDSISEANHTIIQNLVNKKDMKAHAELEKPKPAEPLFHEVKSGENISLIAQKYKLSVSELFLLNPGLEKKQNKIFKGMKIRVSP